MKKILVLISTILLVGCGSEDHEKQIMEEYAKTYYNNHMVMISADKVVITKDMLFQASDEDGYDMSKLQSCSNSSKIVFEIENRQIKNIEYNLDCE